MKSRLALFTTLAVLLGASGLAAAADRGTAGNVDLGSALPFVGPVFLPQAGYAGDLTLLARATPPLSVPSKASLNTMQVVSLMELRQTSAAYVLRPNDLIRIRIFQEPKLSCELRVGAQGSARLPLIGTVKLEGLTAAQAQEAIERAYRDGKFLQTPAVWVQVLEYAPRPEAR